MNDNDIGPQYPQPDPRGWLVFQGLPDDLQRAEDATQHADYFLMNSARARPKWDRGGHAWYWERPATDAERTLLGHLGYTLPDTLTTRIEFASETLRKRRWPQLEGTPA